MLVIGLDFGTLSVRAQVVDTETGAALATAIESYRHGVIDRRLPENGVSLAPQWALQHPQDWLDSMTAAIRAVVEEVDGSLIGGLGIDTTGCSVLPVKSDGTPLSFLPQWKEQPHAWTKLWKHNSAQAQAERFTEAAIKRGEKWLGRCGGAVSPSFMLSKALELLEEAPLIYQEADLLVEESDWLVWQLTGVFRRNAFAAGYLAYIHEKDGPPSREYLASVEPGLASFYQGKCSGEIAASGTPAGTLKPYWAEKLGLSIGVKVAVPTIDGPAGAIGGGIDTNGTMYMVMGTSIVDFLLAEKETSVPGIAGVAADATFPGWYLYGVAQVAVGDAFSWFTEQVGVSHEELTARAADLAPGESGLLALDWWNGGRKPEVDADLSGVVIGYSLQTANEAVYRALIESTAFGSKYVVDTFRKSRLTVSGLRAGGGLTANRLLLQIYADVIGLPLEVTASEQPSTLGAAVLGAVAAGAYESVLDAARVMAPASAYKVEPVPENRATYDALYREYLRLVEMFSGGDSPLRRLRDLRRRID